MEYSKVISYLTKHLLNLQAIYLFGSYATGTATIDSDMDIAILATHKIPSAQLQHSADELASILNLNQVDLVDLRAVNVIFQEEILNSGQRIATFDWIGCETYEDYIHCNAMDFREFRQPLLTEILKRGHIYG